LFFRLLCRSNSRFKKTTNRNQECSFPKTVKKTRKQAMVESVLWSPNDRSICRFFDSLNDKVFFSLNKTGKKKSA